MQAFMRESILNTLQVPIVENFEKYLGLPTFVGKNTWLVFGSIRDRVWQKLKNWQSYKFSKGGQEVLIKVVLLAHPNYFLDVYARILIP